MRYAYEFVTFPHRPLIPFLVPIHLSLRTLTCADMHRLVAVRL